MNLALPMLTFGLVAIAAAHVGNWSQRLRLPLITGFLATGIIAGPYALDLISHDAVSSLGFIDQISLAVIAFAAGNELYLKELRSRLRAIAWVTVAQLVVTFVVGVAAVLLLADTIPFLSDLPSAARWAVALMAGAIMVARSPSSAIAIVSELRARGPFTKTALGATMLMDIAVIALFAACFSAGRSLLAGLPFNMSALGSLVSELLVSFTLGRMVGQILHWILAAVRQPVARFGLVVGLGWAVFAFSGALTDWFNAELSLHLHPEPLLICMVAACWLTNASELRDDLTAVLHDLGPPIYVAFFTLTGASLHLDVLPNTYHVALSLCAVRALGIWLGNHIGGRMAGEPPLHNNIGWAAYLTQAGVALGLAKNVATEFPTWGGEFATTIVALIVVNQIIGPPLMKWAIVRAGEDHSRSESPTFDGQRDALIFGLEGQSIALARQLVAAGWHVEIACPKVDAAHRIEALGVQVHALDRIDASLLAELGMERVDAVVGLLDDERNLALCELVYQHYGIDTVVVHLREPEMLPRFTELGVLVVDPRSAMVNLLERAVRSPSTAAVLLGLDAEHDLVDAHLANVDMSDLKVSELRLPLDVAVLYVHRSGSMIPANGGLRLLMGDRVTLSGPAKDVEAAALKLEG